MGDFMKLALLAATALIASSFTPIAVPALVSGAAALPAPNVLLCTDSSLLGPSRSGHFWGSPYILPVDNTVTTTFDGPFSSEGTEYFIVTETTTTNPIIQRCRVFNWSGHVTGKYQDIEVAPAGTVTRVYNCQETTTPDPGYVECPGAGSSGDTRKPPKT